MRPPRLTRARPPSTTPSASPASTGKTIVIKIDEKNLKHGVLGLVMAVVEILRDALRTQATRRMDSRSLTDEEVERLGRALTELDAAIEEIKREQGLDQAVSSVRDGLDDIVDDAVQRLVAPVGRTASAPGGTEAPGRGEEPDPRRQPGAGSPARFVPDGDRVKETA